MAVQMQDVPSLRDDLLLVCDKLACQGEECVFFSINILTEKIFCCGSVFGQEFLSAQSAIVQSFLDYCKGRHLLRLQSMKSEVDDTANQDFVPRSSVDNQQKIVNQTNDDDVICIISDDDDDDDDDDELTKASTAKSDDCQFISLVKEEKDFEMAQKDTAQEINATHSQSDVEDITQNVKSITEEVFPVNIFLNNDQMIKDDAIVDAAPALGLSKNINYSEARQQEGSIVDSFIVYGNDGLIVEEFTNVSQNVECKAEENESQIVEEFTNLSQNEECKIEPETDEIDSNYVDLGVQTDMYSRMENVSPIKGSLNMCQTCGESFFSFRALKNHIELHKSRRDVKKAYMRIHAGEKPFKCKYCGKQFVDSGPLATHLKIHEKTRSQEGKLYRTYVDGQCSNVCKICDKQFKNAGLLQNHNKRFHRPQKQFKCSVCSKICSNWYNLKRHEVSHFCEKNKFQCRFCLKKFGTKSKCCRHELIHQDCKVHKLEPGSYLKTHSKKSSCKMFPGRRMGSKSFPCHVCSIVCRKYFDLKVHAMKHLKTHAHNCGVCGRHFSGVGHLKVHFKTHVKQSKSRVLKGEETSDEKKLFKCNLCHMKFATKFHFKQHFTMHSKTIIHGKGLDAHKKVPGMKNEVIEDFTVEFESKDGSLKCRKCFRIFSDRSHLKIHMKMHTSGEVYKCRICKRKFNAYSFLKIHLARTHNKESRYYNSFVQVIHAERSEKNISKETSNSAVLVCPNCGQFFSERRYLTMHLNNYCKSAKRCRCSVCFKMFKDFAQLKVHTMKCTLVSRPYQCKICGRRCSTVGKLRQHKQIHQKKGDNTACNKRGGNSNFDEYLNNIECEKTEKSKNIESTNAKMSDVKCRKCGKICLTLGGLKTHLRIHKKEKSGKTMPPKQTTTKTPNNLQELKSETVSKTLYLCRLCDEAFEDCNLLKKHWKVHENMVEKPFECKICSKTFYDKDVLKWHESTHLKNKSHYCKICNIKVFNNATFKIHMQLHKQ